MKEELEDYAQVRSREKMTQRAAIYAPDRPNKQLWRIYQMVHELAGDWSVPLALGRP